MKFLDLTLRLEWVAVAVAAFVFYAIAGVPGGCLGYGLKLSSSFQDTHLGRIGR
ncbi:hypothetical protein [Mesorhizobium sp. M0136]|uniref:hypothetical protein n=1 Tax=unclassified Mesorhizobium TaxID=325217 RepID=UPI0033370B95